jgi:hypothetical protein
VVVVVVKEKKKREKHFLSLSPKVRKKKGDMTSYVLVCLRV